MRPRSIVSLVALLLIVPWQAAHAIELWSSKSGDRYYIFDAALKWTSLVSYAPKDLLLFPERWSGTTLWRGRMTVGAQPAAWINFRLAYEQRTRNVSQQSGSAGAGFLLPTSRAPYRITQLDAKLAEVGNTFSYRHEMDRAFTAFHFGDVELTVGRQAIGWGRGLFFGAVDMFAPFSPLESDREWRRGVDAVRSSIPLSDLISLETLAVINNSAESSAFAARLQGYVGAIDGEMMIGKRADDYFYAVTSSFPLLGAELHGEAALFRTVDGAGQGRDDTVFKGVIGGSYGLNASGQFLIAAEYHYSGFGVRDITQAQAQLQNPQLQARFQRGDSQTLGRHAAALQLSYGLDSAAPIGLSWIFSPEDRSGVFTPSTRWLFSDNVTLIGQLYVAHGSHPVNGRITSEYGATPTGGLIQISFYY